MTMSSRLAAEAGDQAARAADTKLASCHQLVSAPLSTLAAVGNCVIGSDRAVSVNAVSSVAAESATEVKKACFSDMTVGPVVALSDSCVSRTVHVSTPAETSLVAPAKPAAPANPDPVAPAVSAAAVDSTPARRSAADYVFGDEIGCGSFSSVYVARDVHSNRQVAIKVCVKRHILRERKHAYVVRERDILNHVSQRTSECAPFFVQLFCTFQDAERLYFVLTFARRGDLLSHLTKVGTFDSAVVQFYTSELLLAIEHMHRIGVIHRDLKPENILLDGDMHIMVSDFGSAKMVTHADCRLTQADLDCTNPLPCRPDGQTAPLATPARHSFVGTAEYASPELLQEKTTSHASDLWALGCILYQMVSGLPPFRSRSQYLVFRKILALEYEFPAEGFPEVSADLVRQLLVLEPSARLGASDTNWYSSMRAHAFFAGVKFDTLHQQHPPEIYPFLPGTAEHPEFRSTYRVPDNLTPGLTEHQLTCGLFNMALDSSSSASSTAASSSASATSASSPSGGVGISPRVSSYRLCLQLDPAELQRRVQLQQQQNRWHRFVDSQLIIKQGFLEKRKGLFARRRMFLLTTGPRLFYVEPNSMVLKGEVPWSRELRPEAKNFRNFFVHTPGRTYYLEDTEGFALEWVKAIDEVRLHTYIDGNV